MTDRGPLSISRAKGQEERLGVEVPGGVGTTRNLPSSSVSDNKDLQRVSHAASSLLLPTLHMSSSFGQFYLLVCKVGNSG